MKSKIQSTIRSALTTLNANLAVAASFALSASLTVAAPFALSAPAFASRGDMTNFAAIHHDTAEPAALKLVSIDGALSCDLGAENTGQSCDLKLHEAATGKTYNLIEAKSAMQLFQNGDKHVRIEGRLEDPETLAVRSAQIL